MNKFVNMSQASLDAIHIRGEQYRKDKHPIFGYFSVDLFECPPFTIFTNNDCPRAIDIQVFKKFEPMSMRLWCRSIDYVGGAIDVGAHVGIYSLAAAARRPNLPILGFEPNPDVYARFLVNINANNFESIEPLRCGLAHQTGLSQLRWANKGHGYLSSGSSLAVTRSEGFHEVPAVVTTWETVSELIDNSEPLIFKIDVEGSEESVFKGLNQALEKTPDILLESFDRKACEVISEITKIYGYRYFLVNEENMDLHEQKNLIANNPKSRNRNQFLTVNPDRIFHLLSQEPKSSLNPQ